MVVGDIFLEKGGIGKERFRNEWQCTRYQP